MKSTAPLQLATPRSSYATRSEDGVRATGDMASARWGAATGTRGARPTSMERHPGAAQLRAVRALVQDSPQLLQQKAFSDSINGSPRMAAQRARGAALCDAQGTSVVQRALAAKDVEPFRNWLSEQNVVLDLTQFESIVRSHEVSTLVEAQEQATLDAEAQQNITAKHKDYTTKRAKFAKGLNGPRRAEYEKAYQLLDGSIQELTSAQESGGLGPGIVSAVDSLARLLLETHPPSSHTYVCLGNSPAPLLAWLQIQGLGDTACHLPLGGLTTPEGEKRMMEEGPEVVGKTMSAYLNSSLKLVLSRGKPIVLIDYVSTGGSLVITANHIKDWLASCKKDLPVSFFGYSEREADAESVNGLMNGPHEGVLATSEGPAEKIFAKLSADKVLKEFLLIKGPDTLDIRELLDGAGPRPQAAHWKRVLRLMRDAMGAN